MDEEFTIVEQPAELDEEFELVAPPQPQAQAPMSQMDSNPPTALTALVHGFGGGLSYNFMDDAVDTINPGAKERAIQTKREFPLTYALANLGGAILSPNPLGKWKALKDAGLLVKTAVAGGRAITETGLASFGESEKDSVGGRLEDVKETFKNPLVIGGVVLSTGFPSLLHLVKKGADYVVKNGKQSYKLGQDMIDALSSPEGQKTVTSAVNNFEEEALTRIDQNLKALSPAMDEVANSNVGTKVKLQSSLEKTHKFLDGLDDTALTEAELAAKNKAVQFLTQAEEGVLKNSESVMDPQTLLLKSDLNNSDFKAAWDFKKKLGEFVYDPKNGEARILNQVPRLKSRLEKLYAELAEELSAKDKTSTFRDLSKTYSALYKTYDATDSLGDSLAKGSDNLNRTFNKRSEAIHKAFNEIPKPYRANVQDLESLFKVEMPQVYNAYNIAEKIAGRSPASNSLLHQLSAMVSKVPFVGEGSRLQMLNRIGQEETNSSLLPLLTQTPQDVTRIGAREAATMVTPDGDE